MRKKRNDFDAVGFERMTDAELSKKLGSYKRMTSSERSVKKKSDERSARRTAF